MTPFAILLLAITQFSAAAPDLDCDNAMTQHAMNRCAAIAYERADAELNNLWREVRQQMRDQEEVVDDGRPSSWETLLEAQRSWIVFRETHCRLEGYDARGGSLEPLLVSSCLEKLTRQRIEQLEALQVNQISGEPKTRVER